MSGPPALERHTLVLLRRPVEAPDLPDAELDRLQAAHLAHLSALERRGALLVAGPLDDQPDPALRGLCIYRTGLEETRALAEEDPSVRAGRLAVEVLSWWVAPGALSFGGGG